MSCWLSVPVKDEKIGITDSGCASSIPEGEFQDKDRVLYCGPPKKWTRSPRRSTWQFVADLEKSFGIERCTSQVIWFRQERMCFRLFTLNSATGMFGLFTLHSSASGLYGVICLHSDDMLRTGDELFESQLEKVDELIGFSKTSSITAGGSTRNMPMEKLRYSMKAHIQNLKES